jgi:thymidylate synthase (FAD)
MKIIEQSHYIEAIMPENPLEHIEKVARICYKSEDKIKGGSAAKLVKGLLSAKPFPHQAMIEHAFMCVRFITERGVSHELVRHRPCSFAQESTRYVKYSGDMEFIRPVWLDLNLLQSHTFTSHGADPYGEDGMKFCFRESTWQDACINSEAAYKKMLESKATPQEARQVLNNSIKTEIVVTANFREWRHIFQLRCDSHAHPQMQALMMPLLREVQKKVPVIFDDIEVCK